MEEWDRAAEAEQRSRTVFAQHGLRVDEVAQEVEAVRAAVGSGADVEAFVRTAVTVLGGVASGSSPVALDLSSAKVAVRDAVGAEKVRGRFVPPVRDDEVLLGRTHPVVNGLASYVLTSALDAEVESPARRCGVIRTAAVGTRTTLLVVRHRFHLLTIRAGVEEPLLAEECATLAFTGSPQAPVWLADEAVEPLLLAEPSDNVHPAQATDFLQEVFAADGWRAHLVADAEQRAERLREAHERVRDAARQKGVRYRVTQAEGPPDLLGVYVYLPAVAR